MALMDIAWKFVNEHPGCTMEEVRKHMGFTQACTAGYHLANLERAGRVQVTREEGIATYRALTPVVEFG